MQVSTRSISYLSRCFFFPSSLRRYAFPYSLLSPCWKLVLDAHSHISLHRSPDGGRTTCSSASYLQLCLLAVITLELSASVCVFGVSQLLPLRVELPPYQQGMYISLLHPSPCLWVSVLFPLCSSGEGPGSNHRSPACGPMV